MNKLIKPVVSVLLAVTMMSSTITAWAGDASTGSNEVTGQVVQQGTTDQNAESASNNSSATTAEITAADKPYLSLGADLTDDQKATVLSLMGVDATQLASYDVVYVTNEEEHKYLDSYIASSEIGSKSWSSVVIVKKSAGSGLNIATKNISYCTQGMYQNACATAGITDADIVVAGPKAISGTAALVGIFKAYSEMTGKQISEQVIDGALNELVVTGQLENNLSGNVNAQDLENLIADLKQEMVEQGLTDETSIGKAVDDACKEYNITLTDDEKNQIVSLLKKLSGLNLNADILGKAQSFLNGIDTSSVDTQKAGAFFTKAVNAIKDLLKELFN